MNAKVFTLKIEKKILHYGCILVIGIKVTVHLISHDEEEEGCRLHAVLSFKVANIQSQTVGQDGHTFTDEGDNTSDH